METETILAENLRKYDKQTAYDYAAKKVLSDRRVLASILQVCAAEFQDYDVETIAFKFIQPDIEIETVPILPDETNAPREKKQSDVSTQIESVGIEEKTGTEGSTYYDIRFHAIAPGMDELIRLIIALEMQNDFSPGYPLHKRGIYELSRQISSQYGPIFKHSEYGKIRKVYTIFICTAPTASYQNTITRYRMTEENIVGEAHAPEHVYDLTTLVMVCLGNAGEKNYEGLLKMLDILLSNKIEYTEKKTILQKEFDLPMSERIEEGVRQMSNLGKGIAEENRKKGREEGRAEGTFDTTIRDIRNIMDSFKVPLDQAMTALKVPESERPRYKEMLQPQ